MKFDEALKARFLEHFEDTLDVMHSAQACGLTRGAAYYQRANDLEFKQKWDQARDRALDALLGTAYRRATVEKSDQVLITLLRFRYGDEMRDRLAVQVEHSIGLDPEALLRMTREDRTALQQLLGKYAEAEQQQERVLEHNSD